MLKTRARHSLTIAVMPARRQRGALRSDRRIFKSSARPESPPLIDALHFFPAFV